MSVFKQFIYIIKGVMFVCLFVWLYLCSVWPAKRLGRSRPNLTHALMSTQGVFLARSMSRSFMYACGSDRSTKHPAHCAKATPGERLWNSVRTSGNYSSSNEGASRTPSGGRVITASCLYYSSVQLLAASVVLIKFSSVQVIRSTFTSVYPRKYYKPPEV